MITWFLFNFQFLKIVFRFISKVCIWESNFPNKHKITSYFTKLHEIWLYFARILRKPIKISQTYFKFLHYVEIG